jgi:hypothetical protein
MRWEEKEKERLRRWEEKMKRRKRMAFIHSSN